MKKPFPQKLHINNMR